MKVKKIRINNLKIRLSFSIPSLIIALILWYVLSYDLVYLLGLPKAIIYFGDVLNLYIFANAVLRALRKKSSTMYKPIVFMVLFSLSALFSSVINFESPFLILWGARNNFRFFIFFYSCCSYVEEMDVQKLFKYIRIMFWLSVPLCVYQALFVNYQAGTIVGDYVGGVYMGNSGVSGTLNIILIIYVTYIMVLYFRGERNNKDVFLVIGAALLMASLAELKVFIPEIAIIMIITIFQKGFSLKGMFIVVIGFVGLFVAIQLFVKFNGVGRAYYTSDMFAISSMWEIISRSSGYDGVGDLNRITAIPELINRFFKKDILGVLFGMGIGNADYSVFPTLTSSFYNQYKELHYQWFSSSFVFIETGLVGLSMYLAIFASALFDGIKRLKNYVVYKRFYVVLVISIYILIIYNPSMRGEQCAYTMYFFLALPYINLHEKQEGIKDLERMKGKKIV